MKEKLIIKRGKQNSEEIMIFCQNIKRLREKNELSKKEMADILEIGLTSLVKIEHGIVPPRMGADVIFKTSQYFKIKPHELFAHLQ